MPEQWMVEEEEALIRLEQDVDSLLGSHRTHCPECGSSAIPKSCGLAMQLKIAAARTAAARILNQQRQDEATPLPEFSPVKA